MAQLHGKRIAIVTSNSGVEEAALASPRQAVIDAGGTAVLLASEQGDVRTLVHEDAIAFVAPFIEAGKPVAAICHGPWALVESGHLGGKTLTSFPSLQTDVENAGAQWVDEEVHVDPAGGWTLVTSRNPGDLDAYIEVPDDEVDVPRDEGSH